MEKQLQASFMVSMEIWILVESLMHTFVYPNNLMAECRVGRCHCPLCLTVARAATLLEGRSEEREEGSEESKCYRLELLCSACDKLCKQAM